MPTGSVVERHARLARSMPITSQRAFTPGQILNPYATHYRWPFAFCNVLCPLHHGPHLRSGCLCPEGRRRCIGFTSFPKMPCRSADRQTGLGTHFPPGARWGTSQRSTTLDSLAPCLLAPAPFR